MHYLISNLLFVSYFHVFVVRVCRPPGATIHEKQQMRIQEGHFLKNTLNLDLRLSDDGKCPALLESSGIVDLGAFCVELWSSFRQQKNFGPNVIYFVVGTSVGTSVWEGLIGKTFAKT